MDITNTDFNKFSDSINPSVSLNTDYDHQFMDIIFSGQPEEKMLEKLKTFPLQIRENLLNDYKSHVKLQISSIENLKEKSCIPLIPDFKSNKIADFYKKSVSLKA